MSIKKNATFRDLSLSFAPNPFTGDLSVVTDENSVIQSLKNIILTDSFEVPFNSRFGGNIRALLFEQSSIIVASELEDRIRTAIENYEPRIEILDLKVQDDSDNSRYVISLIFTIVTSDAPQNISFFLERLQ